MHLRYGINPHQRATAAPVHGDHSPVRILTGSPSYINMLDALNGWQLVREASRTLGRPAAASFKHVSPAGAGSIDEVIAELYGVDISNVESVTSAYLRARDADPKCSYGDLAAVSGPVGAELADVLGRVVCDGIIAPGYEPGVVGALSRKQNGRFLVIEADECFTPPAEEVRDVWGVRLTQQRDTAPISTTVLDDVAGDIADGRMSASTVDDLLLGVVVLRYTQSNSVCYLRDGVTLGIGAGQQSRVDCTRLAGSKVDTWCLRRHPVVRNLRFRPQVRRQDRINAQISFVDGDLSAADSLRLTEVLAEPAPIFTNEERAAWLGQLHGVAFASDGLLPFRDNVDRAARHGVAAIVEPGGSVRSTEVEDACREHGIVPARTGLRLFHH